MKLIPNCLPRALLRAAALLATGVLSGRAHAADAPPAEFKILEPLPDPAIPEAPTPPAAPEPSPAPPQPAPAVATPPPVAARPAAVQSVHPGLGDETPSRWYGWQTLAADGMAVALTVGSIALAGSGGEEPSSALGWGALGTYVLGAPVLHFVHENPGRGFASLGMRVVGPIALGVLGAAAEDCANHGGEFCGVGGAVVGATMGIVAAITIDAAVFAYDDPPEGAALAPRFRLGLSPRGVVAFGAF
ncbi:MAG: hypothetical protein ABUL60_12155 [Myxococcales bacterium]